MNQTYSGEKTKNDRIYLSLHIFLFFLYFLKFYIILYFVLFFDLLLLICIAIINVNDFYNIYSFQYWLHSI